MKAVQASKDLSLCTLVTGMHLSPRFGTVEEIIADGFEITERVEIPLDGDTASDIGKAIAGGVAGFSDLFQRWRPDILLVQGDRFEIFAAALASLPFGIPLAHMHGGELTLGAIDEPMRHATTKMAHLHFVSTEVHAKRVRQLGEEDWRITVSGAPSLDNLDQIELTPPNTLLPEFSFDVQSPPLLVTFHPETRGYGNTNDHVNSLLQALDKDGGAVVFTAPNADTHGDIILTAIEEFCATRTNARLVNNLGTKRYFSLMSCARAMVGNSSSGIVEAGSFKLPVINIGSRQKGRLAGANVVHAAADTLAILSALQRVDTAEFRSSIKGMQNPYGDGKAAQRITKTIRDTPMDRTLVEKGFVDI